jgi:hypothetical protein
VTEPAAPETARALAERAAAAYEALAELAETVEDEWQYVTDLVEAYLPSIRALAGGSAGSAELAGPDRILPAETVFAVDEAIAEIELVADPHKAIDWLSTFPHVVALAMGGDVDSPAGGPDGGDGPGPDADDDSPFRALLGRGR